LDTGEDEFFKGIPGIIPDHGDDRTFRDAVEDFDFDIDLLEIRGETFRGELFCILLDIDPFDRCDQGQLHPRPGPEKIVIHISECDFDPAFLRVDDIKTGHKNNEGDDENNRCEG